MSLNNVKTAVLDLLPIGFGLFLTLLAVGTTILLFTNAGQDNATGRASIFGELLLTIAFLFLLFDYVIFHMNKRQDSERTTYYPNVKFLCMGLLTGMGTAILYLFCRVSLYYITPPLAVGQGGIVAAENSATVWRNELTIFIILALLLALTLWAIVRVGREE